METSMQWPQQLIFLWVSVTVTVIYNICHNNQELYSQHFILFATYEFAQ